MSGRNRLEGYYKLFYDAVGIDTPKKRGMIEVATKAPIGKENESRQRR